MKIEWKYDCSNCEYSSEQALQSKCVIQRVKAMLDFDSPLQYVVSDDFLESMKIAIDKECGSY